MSLCEQSVAYLIALLLFGMLVCHAEREVLMKLPPNKNGFGLEGEKGVSNSNRLLECSQEELNHLIPFCYVKQVICRWMESVVKFSNQNEVPMMGLKTAEEKESFHREREDEKMGPYGVFFGLRVSKESV